MKLRSYSPSLSSASSSAPAPSSAASRSNTFATEVNQELTLTLTPPPETAFSARVPPDPAGRRDFCCRRLTRTCPASVSRPASRSASASSSSCSCSCLAGDSFPRPTLDIGSPWGSGVATEGTMCSETTVAVLAVTSAQGDIAAADRAVPLSSAPSRDCAGGGAAKLSAMSFT